jgi:hypothetical protein
VADGYKSAFNLIFCTVYLANNTDSVYNFICSINMLKKRVQTPLDAPSAYISVLAS